MQFISLKTFKLAQANFNSFQIDNLIHNIEINQYSIGHIIFKNFNNF